MYSLMGEGLCVFIDSTHTFHDRTHFDRAQKATAPLIVSVCVCVYSMTNVSEQRQDTWTGSSRVTWACPPSYTPLRSSSAPPSPGYERRTCPRSQTQPSWRWEPRRIAGIGGRRITGRGTNHICTPTIGVTLGE